MGQAQYNRDQRIANRIIDSLIDFGAHGGAGSVTSTTIFRACIAGLSVAEGNDFVKPRVFNILQLLVEYGAVTRVVNDEDVAVYFIGFENYRGVRDVARGTFLP